MTRALEENPIYFRQRRGESEILAGDMKGNVALFQPILESACGVRFMCEEIVLKHVPRMRQGHAIEVRIEFEITKPTKLPLLIDHPEQLKSWGTGRRHRRRQ